MPQTELDRRSSHPPKPLSAEELFAGPGEVRALCRAADWSATPLGPVETWPLSLTTTVRNLLASRHPKLLFWGPELVQFYNDAFRPSLAEGGRHLRALGARGKEFWTDVWDVISPQIAQVMSGGESTWHEDHLVPIERNGRLEEVYWTYSYGPAYDDEGNIGGVLVVVQETTSRVLSERRLSALNRQLEVERSRLAYVFQRAPTFLAVMRSDPLRFEFANEAYYQLVGHRDLIGRTVEEAIPEARAQGFIELLDQVLRTGEPYIGREVSIRLARTPEAPLEERVLDFVYYPMIEVDGSRSGLIAHGADVTDHVGARQEIERLLAESEDARAALEASEARLRAEVARGAQFAATVEQATDFVGIATPAGEAFFINRAGRALVGLPDEEAAARTTVLDYFPDDWKPRVRTELLPHLLRHGSWRGEVMFRHFQTGESIPVEWNAFVVHAPGTATPTALACVARDLRGERAARLERERLLREEAAARQAAEAAYAEAHAANRAKGEFLAMMSHELRTPLNAIGGYAELIALGVRGPVTEQQLTDLSRIQQSQRHLLGLINQVLNYTRIDSRAVHYELADIPVVEALDEAEALVAPQIRERGLRYSQSICSPPGRVRADREKLQQILLNLLSNAVKFTDAGGEIHLSCRSEGDRVLLTVRDTGIGIAPEKLRSVFEPFVQVDQRLTRPNEGVGLGLAISRELARGMGGDLTAESTIGEGSTFTLTLPRA